MKRIKVILQLIYDLLILRLNFFIVTSKEPEPINYCRDNWPKGNSKTISGAITSKFYMSNNLMERIRK